MENNTKKYLIYLGIIGLYGFQVIVIFITGFEGIFEFTWRFSGLIGITSIFFGIITSAFIKQLTQIFESTYLNIHHYFSLVGIILITLHPITMAIEFGTLAIFIPDFSSWIAFWSAAGRIGFYLLYISTIIALFRKYSTEYWRYVHVLIYLVFLFGAIHGLLKGDDLQNILMGIIYIGMIIIIIGVFVYKRISRWKLNHK